MTRKPKEIVDTPAVAGQIEAQPSQKNHNRPHTIIAQLKTAFDAGRAHAKEQFEQSNRPSAYLKAMTQTMDELMLAVYAEVKAAHPSPAFDEVVCCVAVGGYGRKELFPYSDVDLLFLYQGKKLKAIREHVESFLYYLWDLGLQVGYSVRTAEEAIELSNSDHTIASNLLDARFLAGNHTLFDTFSARFMKQVIGSDPPRYVEAKLKEREQRHIKHGDSRFLLEPNIKENKGGLRDLHTLYWLAHYGYGTRSIRDLVARGLLTEHERRKFKHAEQFLWTVRVHLHLLAGRAEERLTFDMQLRIGERLGYRTSDAHRPVERFMKRYFQVAKNVGDLTRLFCALLEEEHKHRPRLSLMRLLERQKHIDEFKLEGQRLDFLTNQSIKENPSLILKLFHTAQEHNLDIHPRALQQISRSISLIDDTLRQDPHANALFMQMLLSDKGPENTLRRLNEANVLGKFIPDFGLIVGLMQYDMYHIYTVDEHIIRALGILHSIEKGEVKDELPLATDVIQHVTKSRHVLYLALLCHDIAKGRGGNHPVIGEAIVRKLAARFGLSEQEADTAAWLVREHILFTDIAFKRDLDDPQTIADFVAVVQSPERLRLLLVLSVSDIRAVGPMIWNGWKGALIRKLYHQAEAFMGATDFSKNQEAIEQFKHQMQAALSSWSLPEVERYLDLGFPGFWLSLPIETHVTLAHLLRSIWDTNEPYGYHYEIDRFRSITHLTLCLPHHHALLTYVSGCVTLIGASILGAKLYNLRNGLTVAMLEIQDIQNQAFDDIKRLDQWSQYLIDSISGRMNLQDAIWKQRRKLSVRLHALGVNPSVFIDNKLSERHTVIEVNGLDRPGLLYDIASALADVRLTISTAHITTYGEKAVDVFYVKDTFGLKIYHPDKLEAIRARISLALSEEGTRQAS